MAEFRVDTEIIDASHKVDSLGDGIAGFKAQHAGLAARQLAESPMNVNNVGSNTPVQKIVSNPIQKSIPAEAPKNVPATDRLQLSGASHLLDSLKTNDVRTDKVAAIRAQLADGTYESDAKLDGAVDKLLDDLNK